MYQLFTEQQQLAVSTIHPPGFEIIKRQYEAQLIEVTSYLANRVYTVPSQHLLVRLLNTADVPHWYSIDAFAETALTRSSYISKHFNFTSSINYGTVWDGVFYGPGNTEFIVSYEEYFNPQEAMSNWRTLRPVQVLEHPMTDLGLGLPDGRSRHTDVGLCVIAINIPLLLVQYHGWLMEQTARRADIRLGATHFIHMHVLPNMLYSHLEIALNNRLMALVNGAPMGDATTHYPIALSDYSARLDRVLTEVARHIRDAPKLYQATLLNMPSISYQSGYDALRMPDIAPTRQVWWLLLLTRWRMMTWLIYTGGHRGRSVNGMLIARLRIDIRRLLNDNILHSVLPKDMYFDLISDISDIINEL